MVQGLVGEEIFENFGAMARAPAGAVDAQPLVRKLHEAWQGIGAAERAYDKAMTELREQERYLGSVSTVLERLSATVESLLRVFPATLYELMERCRGSTSASSLGPHSAGVRAGHLHPMSPNLIASGSRDGTVRVWRAEGTKDSQDLPTWSCIGAWFGGLCSMASNLTGPSKRLL